MTVSNQYKPIGNGQSPAETLLMKKIGLGTAQFGLDYGISNHTGQTTEQEVVEILNLAHQHGLELLDTAQAYGSSEEVIGRNHHQRFDIVTKIIPGTGQASAKMLIEESLKRLMLDTLYGVLFHSAESAFANPIAYQELLNLKNEGHIKKVGFSVYKPQELEELIERYGVPDIIQVPFSHLDRRFENLLIKLHEKGVEIHTRSTFLQGLFFMKPDELNSFFQPVKEYLNSLLKNFPKKEELAGFLLSYVTSRPFINKVVLGVNNLSQLQDNLKVLKFQATEQAIEVPEIPENILMPNLWVKN